MGRHGQMALVVSAGALAVFAVAGGCTGGSPGRAAKGSTRLSPSDFAAAAVHGEGLAPSGVPVLAVQEPEPESRPLGTGPMAASEGVINVAASAGPPKATGPVSPSGAPLLVDAKIGDINGKPVYASKFLSTRTEFFRAKAEELRQKGGRDWRQQWRTQARDHIRTGLETMIEQELLRAEAVASLTPEQRYGLFRLLDRVSDDLASKNRGSITAAAQSLGDQSVQDYVQEAEVTQLIGFQLQKSVHNRVNISWRDIKQWYETHPELYNKPPKARFRLVQISNRNTQAIEEFSSALEAGNVSFEELAKRPYNANSPQTGGLEEKVITGERASMEFYGNAELNKAAQSVEPGRTAGPIVYGSYTAWLHLERIVDESKSLYDEQILIEAGLKALKTQAERQKYIARLRSKATVTSTEEMTARLLAIAEDRYLPKEN